MVPYDCENSFKKSVSLVWIFYLIFFFSFHRLVSTHFSLLISSTYAHFQTRKILKTQVEDIEIYATQWVQIMWCNRYMHVLNEIHPAIAVNQFTENSMIKWNNFNNKIHHKLKIFNYVVIMHIRFFIHFLEKLALLWDFVIEVWHKEDRVFDREKVVYFELKSRFNVNFSNTKFEWQNDYSREYSYFLFGKTLT